MVSLEVGQRIKRNTRHAKHSFFEEWPRVTTFYSLDDGLVSQAGPIKVFYFFFLLVLTAQP